MEGDCTPSLADDEIERNLLVELSGLILAWRFHSDDRGAACGTLEAAAVAVRERDALEQWKREATAVIERWERVYEALDSPSGLGQFRSDLALAEVLLRKAERDALAARVEQLETAIAAHEDCCGTDFWPELREAVPVPEPRPDDDPVLPKPGRVVASYSLHRDEPPAERPERCPTCGYPGPSVYQDAETGEWLDCPDSFHTPSSAAPEEPK